MNRPLHAVILAAGRGTRMKSPTPKVLFDVCGRSALGHVVDLARRLEAETLTIVVAPGFAEVCAADAGSGPPPPRMVVQDPPLGTGHAVRCALDALGAADGDLLVLYGDGPLYTEASLRAVLARHRETDAGATVLSALQDDPTGYGRLVGPPGQVDRIVEELDADLATRALREVNTGILVFRLTPGREVVAGLENANAKGEYYLTDVVAGLRRRGLDVGRVAVADAAEAIAFNTLAELSRVRAVLRARICREHQQNGVDIVDPATTYIDVGVRIGAGTTILPCTVIAAGVEIGERCVVGPFSHLRVGTVLESKAEIGNFTEVKKSRLGAGSKAKHLTYLGDTEIGRGTNIGCGTITANYDGRAKHATRIGDGAFIGSGTVLIAPAEVGDRAVTGAGAIVTRNTRIEDGEVYVGVPARPLRKGDRQ